MESNRIESSGYTFYIFFILFLDSVSAIIGETWFSWYSEECFYARATLSVPLNSRWLRVINEFKSNHNVCNEFWKNKLEMYIKLQLRRRWYWNLSTYKLILSRILYSFELLTLYTSVGIIKILSSYFYHINGAPYSTVFSRMEYIIRT